MIEDKSSQKEKKLPVGNELFRSFDSSFVGKSGFRMNKSYMQDSSYVVDWQLPKKRAEETSH